MAVEGLGADKTQWETRSIKPGQMGLQLNKALDGLDPQELARMVNVVHTGDGTLFSRPGQTLLCTLGSNVVHSAARLNNPSDDTFTRFWGAGTVLQYGTTGVAATIDAGYSGHPLSMVPMRPKLSGDSWIAIADINKMRQVKRDASYVLPMGLPVPTAPTTALGTENKTTVCAFDTSDTTQAASWHATGGFDRGDPIQATPAGTVADNPGMNGVGDAVAFIADRGVGTVDADGYYSVFGLGKNLNLNLVGAVAAEDDDIFHIGIQTTSPDTLEEVRIYLVCSDVYYQDIIPGTSPTANLDAYWKSFRASDLTNALNFTDPLTDIVRDAQANTATKDYFDTQKTRVLTNSGHNSGLDDRTTWAARRAADIQTNANSNQLVPGPQWTEFGVVGVPLRRGDFTRIGNAPGRDWSTITGFIIVIQTTNGGACQVNLDDFYLTGGSGPDTSEPGNAQYDYKVTNYDPRTGDESNGSVVMATTLWLDALRRSIVVTPSVYGDATVLQRFYRRGGTVLDDWYFLGANTADGGIFTDTLTDDAVRASATVPTDHDQPITTVNSVGTTVYAQPLPYLWGPVNGLLIGTGDPYRPGHIYWSKPGEYGHWPGANTEELCAPSEELMGGCVFAGSSYTFSRDRMYENFVDLQTEGQVRSAPTTCIKGLVSPGGLAVTKYGIAFISRDGVYITSGGEAKLLSDNIRPLFEGGSLWGYTPIDFTNIDALRLAVSGHDLWLSYSDGSSGKHQLVYSLLYNYWRAYDFTDPIISVFAEPTTLGLPLTVLGSATGKAYTHDGFSDNGAVIPCHIRTGPQDFGMSRQDKKWGDVLVYGILGGATLSLTPYLNDETVTNDTMTVVTSTDTGLGTYLFDPFGTEPQMARTLSLDLAWSSPITAVTSLHRVSVSHIPQPDLIMKRATDWDDLGTATEKYVYGVLLECDTFGDDVDIIVQYDLQGQWYDGPTLTVNHLGRHKIGYSWDVLKANLLRLQPNTDCGPLIIYRADWNFTSDPEPPRITRWDSNWENKWDTYYTGLDIECDTFGFDKTIEIFVDQSVIKTVTLNATGRSVKHITLGPGRGHVYRFRATDDNYGLLYAHRWFTEPEPSEQTNWNQNYTVAGSLAPKYLKGVLLEADTFGEDKTVNIELDGAAAVTITANHNGRSVSYYDFPQVLGRLFRLLPIDANPGRLYTIQWVFDQEPLKLLRWETQELDFGQNGFFSALYSHVTIKSTANVDMTLVTTTNQTGSTFTHTYNIPSTADAKVKTFVPHQAIKGVLTKIIFTSDAGFYLYREESTMVVQPWGTGKAVSVSMFGNDDLDPTRNMGSAALAAATPGGMAQ